MDDDLCDKYFVKLLGDLGRYIHDTWKQHYTMNTNVSFYNYNYMSV